MLRNNRDYTTEDRYSVRKRNNSGSLVPNHKEVSGKNHNYTLGEKQDNSKLPQNMFNKEIEETFDRREKRTMSSNRLIIGRVNFVLKIHKVYPDIVTFYEIYGTLIKLTKGKYFGQYVLVLKNLTGPALEAYYYEFDCNDLSRIKIGQQLRCVGKFLKPNKKFNIFKLALLNKIPSEETFSRIENLSEFLLNCNKKS